MDNTSEKLNELLDFLEENIDLKHIEDVEKLHLDAINYKEVPYLPLSVLYPIDEKYELYPYQEVYDDPEKMLFNELLWSFSSIYNSVKVKDHFPLHIRSNHGVGILASLFGGRCKIVNGNMPWVDHFESIDEVKEVIKKGMPDIETALGGKVISTNKYYMDRLKEYPNCFKGIHISQPDLQGSFDIAHLLLGTNIYYEIYDNPEILHKLLEQWVKLSLR